MTILICGILSVVLIAAGYIGTCYYLNNIGDKTMDLAVLKPNKRKVLYLAFGMATAILLITLFQLIYRQPLLSQMRLLTLALLILPMACVDAKTQKIPNRFLLVGLAIWALFTIAEFIFSAKTAVGTLLDGLLGAAIIGGFFLLLLLIFKNSIGMGDIKLFALMGLYQGLWGAVNAVFFSLLVSFVLSVLLLITKKKNRKDTIPFGPSILFGTIIAISLSGM